MHRVGAPLRRESTGGRKAGGGRARRRRAAAAAAVAALTGLAACAGPGGPGGLRDPAAWRAASSAVHAGVDLYEAGDTVLAARRFAEAAEGAHRAGDWSLERRATAAECMAWLQARELASLDGCSRRLEGLQRRARRTDPGVNTLIAVGAVAGARPMPRLRIPIAVRPFVAAANRESL
jgi:hypothetical protein